MRKRDAFSAAVRTVLVCALIAVPVRLLAEPPSTPDFAGIPVDPYGQTPGYECFNQEPSRPGSEQFRDMVLGAYPESASGDIWGPCNTHSPFSLHHAGRAWDWFITVPGNLASDAERAVADELVNWLLEPVDGERHMRLRRLGITEIIWFDHIWTSESRRWHVYDLNGCPDPDVSNTTCHRDHVHFTFTVEGANGHTSWWLGLLGWWLAFLGNLFPR